MTSSGLTSFSGISVSDVLLTGEELLTFLDGEDGCENLSTFFEIHGSAGEEGLKKCAIPIIVIPRDISGVRHILLGKLRLL